MKRKKSQAGLAERLRPAQHFNIGAGGGRVALSHAARELPGISQSVRLTPEPAARCGSARGAVCRHWVEEVGLGLAARQCPTVTGLALSAENNCQKRRLSKSFHGCRHREQIMLAALQTHTPSAGALRC